MLRACLNTEVNLSDCSSTHVGFCALKSNWFLFLVECQDFHHICTRGNTIAKSKPARKPEGKQQRRTGKAQINKNDERAQRRDIRSTRQVKKMTNKRLSRGLTGGVFNYRWAQTHLYACRRVRYARRKLRVTAGSEKAKWKQLPRKGWEGYQGRGRRTRIQERMPIPVYGIKYMVGGK